MIAALRYMGCRSSHPLKKCECAVANSQDWRFLFLFWVWFLGHLEILRSCLPQMMIWYCLIFQRWLLPLLYIEDQRLPHQELRCDCLPGSTSSKNSWLLSASFNANILDIRVDSKSHYSSKTLVHLQKQASCICRELKMRYQTWDVLVFPDHCKIPLQEFKTSCQVIQDPGMPPRFPAIILRAFSFSQLD